MGLFSVSALSVVWLSVAPAWGSSLPPEVDAAVTPSLGQREDAVARLAKTADATTVLIAVLHEDPAPEVRARAAKALFDQWAAGEGDVATLRATAVWAAAHSDDGIRAAAVRALGDVGDDYPLVVPYLDDESAAVQAAALAACERWAERHPDRAAEANEAIAGRELGMEGKARRLLEKVRAKMP